MSEQKYLRVKRDGTIFRWNAILAANPECEEVTEAEAFPEKTVTPERMTELKARKPKLDLSALDDMLEEPKRVAPEIEREASKGLPE